MLLLSEHQLFFMHNKYIICGLMQATVTLYICVCIIVYKILSLNIYSIFHTYIISIALLYIPAVSHYGKRPPAALT